MSMKDKILDLTTYLTISLGVLLESIDWNARIAFVLLLIGSMLCVERIGEWVIGKLRSRKN